MPIASGERLKTIVVGAGSAAALAERRDLHSPREELGPTYGIIRSQDGLSRRSERVGDVSRNDRAHRATVGHGMAVSTTYGSLPRLQRVSPAEAGKSAEISVVRVQLALVLDGERGEVRVRSEVARDAELAEKMAKQLEMAGPRIEYLDVAPIQPRTHVRNRV
jgi:hypothetical protein